MAGSLPRDSPSPDALTTLEKGYLLVLGTVGLTFLTVVLLLSVFAEDCPVGPGG